MEKQPNSRTCFLCGRENDISLKMSWYNDYEHQQIVSKITISENFNSFPNIVHGGIVAAVLDETAGRAIMLDKDWDNLMVTIKLEVLYRHRTPCNEPLTVVGWIVKKSKNRAQVAGEIRRSDGTVTASCTAIIVRPPKDFFETWEKEKEFWRVYPD